MFRIITLLAAGAAILMPGAAFAQDKSDDDASSVVVIGKPLPDRPTVRRIVNKIATPVDGQLARFSEPVCPSVTGIPDPYGAEMVERIRTIADEAGAPVAKPGCKPNLFVVVVDDGRKFAAEMYRRYPKSFTSTGDDVIKRVTREAGPARAWNITLQRDAMGLGLPAKPQSTAREVEFNGLGGVTGTLSNNVQMVRAYSASILNPNVQQTIERTYVVMNADAVMGKHLMQLADYAAMRGLAMTDPDQMSDDADSILTLFDPKAGHASSGLTDFDRAYLKGLYYGPGPRTGASQRNSIVRKIVKSGFDRKDD